MYDCDLNAKDGTFPTFHLCRTVAPIPGENSWVPAAHDGQSMIKDLEKRPIHCAQAGADKRGREVEVDVMQVDATEEQEDPEPQRKRQKAECDAKCIGMLRYPLCGARWT